MWPLWSEGVVWIIIASVKHNSACIITKWISSLKTRHQCFFGGVRETACCGGKGVST